MKQVFDRYSKYYDDIYRQKNYTLEAKFIKGIIEKYSEPKAKNILSIGCGTCNHECILAKSDYLITGLDQSQSMIDIAKKKISKSLFLNKIKLIKANARDFSFNDKFDVVMELFNIFGYHITNEDVNKVLKNVNKSLKVNGVFIFDCWYLPAVLRDKPTDKIKEIIIKNRHLIRITNSKLQTDKNILEIKFRILNISKNVILEDTEETHQMRYWSLPELEYLLNSNGFKLVKTGNFLDIDTPVSENYWNIFVIAKKVK